MMLATAERADVGVLADEFLERDARIFNELDQEQAGGEAAAAFPVVPGGGSHAEFRGRGGHLDAPLQTPVLQADGQMTEA